MTGTEKELHTEAIRRMTYYEMARLYRFAPSGHIYFDTNHPELYAAFVGRFKELGGMTPELSKRIGWQE